MKIPFNVADFLGVFQRYNETIWPLQLIFYAMAIFAALSIFRPHQYTSIMVFSFLSFFWIWMGAVYHIALFSQINKAAYVFGVFFIVQGIIFLYFGVYRRTIRLELTRDTPGLLGVLFLIYALVLYPIIGRLVGHVYPAAPTFGVPCPTTIFTFALLLFAKERIPWYVVIIPFLWSLIGLSAAIDLSMPQDFGLVVAGAAASVIGVFFKPKPALHHGLVL